MYTLLIALALGALTGTGLGAGRVCGTGWCVFWGVTAFFATNVALSMWFRRKVKEEMDRVQAIMAAGQKRLQVKMARWQVRPPGSVQAAQAEIAREQKSFLSEAMAVTEGMHRFDGWVPLMKRQIATAQFQFYWMLKDFRKVDEILPLVIFADPSMYAMKLARMHMLNRPIEEMEKTYRKAVRRLRYNQNVLPAATWSWILLKRGDVDAAFRTLNKALENSDDATLKANREHLANNRTSHFSNSALGDRWYALMLEEPKVHRQRQRMQWR